MLVAMAGLPGTGKSTLAHRLAEVLGGVVLSKDTVRSALFPSPVLDYSAEQDEIAITAVYAAARRIRNSFPERPVFIDGRTFSRSGQVRDLQAVADALGESLLMIECICSDSIAAERLARDSAAGTHPAGNRTPDLYAAAKARAEALAVPRLTLDTGTMPLEECERRALAYLTVGRA